MSSIKIGDDSSLKISSIKSEKQFSEIKDLSLIKAMTNCFFRKKNSLE